LEADTPPDVATQPPPRIYRLGHGPDPWAWPDWARRQEDGTFGNRWDDPDGQYRVLYASTQRLGTFIETLARFRPDPAVAAELASMEDADDGLVMAPGQVPKSWLDKRRIGAAQVDGEFADVGHSEWLVWLHRRFAGMLIRLGIRELDASALRSAARPLTQAISRRIYELTIEGERRFAGIAYLSRLGDEFQNWAIFEPAAISADIPGNIQTSDVDLAIAMQRFGLVLVDSRDGTPVRLS
jgi:hypothetical protein